MLSSFFCLREERKKRKRKVRLGDSLWLVVLQFFEGRRKSLNPLSLFREEGSLNGSWGYLFVSFFRSFLIVFVRRRRRRRDKDDCGTGADQSRSVRGVQKTFFLLLLKKTDWH